MESLVSTATTNVRALKQGRKATNGLGTFRLAKKYPNGMIARNVSGEWWLNYPRQQEHAEILANAIPYLRNLNGHPALDAPGAAGGLWAHYSNREATLLGIQGFYKNAYPPNTGGKPSHEHAVAKKHGRFAPNLLEAWLEEHADKLDRITYKLPPRRSKASEERQGGKLVSTILSGLLKKRGFEQTAVDEDKIVFERKRPLA